MHIQFISDLLYCLFKTHEFALERGRVGGGVELVFVHGRSHFLVLGGSEALFGVLSLIHICFIK